MIPTAALGEVEVTRGFTQFDGTVDGRKLRFVNTHLEAYSNDFKEKQGTEIVRGPARSSLPTIVIGDLITTWTGSTRPKARLLRSYITGARKIRSVGVYPADHAGVVSELRAR